jgi:hypothetical protein
MSIQRRRVQLFTERAAEQQEQESSRITRTPISQRQKINHINMESKTDTKAALELAAKQDDKGDQTVDETTFTEAPAVTNVQQEKKVTRKPPQQAATYDNVYSKIWTIVDDLQIPLIQHDEKSSYIPNSFRLFEVLDHMNNMIIGNENLFFNMPKFLIMPVQLYYAILFYLQIVRVKKQAGVIRRTENRWLNSLINTYSEESLPVAGPLIPIFENITFLEPTDRQFPLIYPSLPEKAIYSTTVSRDRTEVTIDPTYHLLPAVPIMLDIFKKFCNKRTIEESDYDEHGYYVPFQLTDGGSLGGINFEAQTGNGALPVAKAQMFYNPGLAYGPPESRAKMSELHHKWKPSVIRKIPTPSITENYNPETIGELTMMNDSNAWFATMIEAAMTHASYFEGQTNLSRISITGSNSIAVDINIEFDEFKTRPTTTDRWYPDYISNLKAGARTTVPTLSLQEQWQSLFALTNARISWKDSDGHQIGSKEAEHRTGPFWENKKYNYEEPTLKSVMARTGITIRREFYRAKGLVNKET